MKWTLLLLFIFLPCVHCVIPTGILSVDLLSPSQVNSSVLIEKLCSPSAADGWGKALPARFDSHWNTLIQLPEGNRDGCVSYKLQDDTMTLTSGMMVIVDRGNCSFVAKALKAQAAGAKGLIIRGTKRAVYEGVMSHNSTNSSAMTSKPHVDVEKAAAPATNWTEIDKPVFEYDCSRGQAFVDKLATPLWQTDADKCKYNNKCVSRSCVLTGHTTMKESGKKYQVCCLWDTFVLMGATNQTVAKALTIPVIYVTIANGQEIQTFMDKYPKLLMARTYRREVPVIDVSSVLLWAIGVATALGAAYYSAYPQRCHDDNMAPCDRQKLYYEQDAREEGSQAMRDEVWELDATHALGFIALAGAFLTVLYYVKVGGAIPVLFAMSGVVAVTQVVARPAVEKWMPGSAIREVTVPFLGETIRLSELLGFLPSCALAIVWYLHRRTYWALQDIMGICLCFVFLRTVQLPNLKVASVLLTLAFCYDVFFVFLSPLFFGSSVMEDVATGGPAAYTKSDYPGVDYCERYPQYPACVNPEPMPMLIVLPRILEWAGGVNMVGLGDIILPGMLLSFALQYDYANSTNYFRFMAVGYAVGLALANLAATITRMGQPALMYLVPTTLGLLLFASKRNGDFQAMWIGIGVDKKMRNREGSRYQAVGLEEVASSGVVIGDVMGHDLREGDDQPLLNSSRS
ncbi:unnamed protein product [Peronospora belbahrii]|uniref:PA domain-containing protein n=1 Tax=Peronospora belbahrii TaxID=622444 RepID=A0AAU9KL35_9STRA|nr:unnamed protein product [Peronospora belbahrii]CAH0518911.1 unnamed protein product [Peronospora belbahrii]